MEGYRFPADFEPHEAIWMNWPNYDAFSGENAIDETCVTIDMIKALSPYTKVKLVVDTNAVHNITGILTKNKISLTGVQLIPMPYLDIGTRDFGPIYITKGRDKKSVHFPFTYWGSLYWNPPNSPIKELMLDEKYGTRAARTEHIDVVESLNSSEGGNRSFNGKGTMLSILPTELQRNPDMTQTQIEAEFRETLGVTNFVWLRNPVVEDQEPNVASWPGPDAVTKNAYTFGAEHTDEVAQFAPNNKILLAEVPEAEAATHPILAENRRRLEANYSILKSARDQDGDKFEIVRIPAAPLTFYPSDSDDDFYQWMASINFLDGSMLAGNLGLPVYIIAASSYTNAIASNGVVVVPKYWKPGLPETIGQKDEKVRQIYQYCYPNRQIVQVNDYLYNIGAGGGIHCTTQQEPKVN